MVRCNVSFRADEFPFHTPLSHLFLLIFFVPRIPSATNCGGMYFFLSFLILCGIKNFLIIVHMPFSPRTFTFHFIRNVSQKVFQEGLPAALEWNICTLWISARSHLPPSGPIIFKYFIFHYLFNWFYYIHCCRLERRSDVSGFRC